MANVLTIAGSDCGGGAGIQADIKTCAAHGVYSMSVITALTAQNTQTVSAIHSPPASFVAEQMRAIFVDIQTDVIKTGMLVNSAIIDTVVQELAPASYKFLVVDPVMVAKSKARLLAADAIISLRQRLLPLADLITPNIPEAADLLYCSEADVCANLPAAAQKLLALGPRAVLLKGGHTPETDNITDTLTTAEFTRQFSSKRLSTRNTHGTGCTLAAAIAANIALGNNLLDATVKARTYLNSAIFAADNLQIGQGCGPLCHHFDVECI